ncbi:MerR family transcriptional regulator [Proteinivorax tanatarense]|uniref:MerR family transcriptional regulator n=1 Tax=Proteinivorax tanatarense TaxID=1260629 RepID=A0AAU7VPB1_9FIRM
MKKTYNIGEIAELYNIGPDSLRYYEKKGLISPARSDNGYRVYTLNDIWKLNIIKDLRKLNFSTNQIKNYLKTRDIRSTINLMETKIDIIEQEIEPLLKVKKALQKKVGHLKEFTKLQKEEQIEIKNINSRKILFIDENISTDYEVDLAFRKLEGLNDKKLFLFGNKDMGVLISQEGMKSKDYTLYEKAFFIVEKDEDIYNAILPAGKYLSITYRGDYSKSQKLFSTALNYISEQGYKTTGQAMEIYRLDIHGTEKKEEFITEIQIPLK